MTTTADATTAADPKIATIRSVYAAFGRGDLTTILEHVTDDVDWAAESTLPNAPWHGPHQGKEELPAFFGGLAETLETLEFTPLAFTSNETDVMVVVRYVVRSRSTGRNATMNLHHWWRFRDGLISWYRGAEDSAATAAVLVP